MYDYRVPKEASTRRVYWVFPGDSPRLVLLSIRPISVALRARCMRSLCLLWSVSLLAMVLSELLSSLCCHSLVQNLLMNV